MADVTKTYTFTDTSEYTLDSDVIFESSTAKVDSDVTWTNLTNCTATGSDLEKTGGTPNTHDAKGESTDSLSISCRARWKHGVIDKNQTGGLDDATTVLTPLSGFVWNTHQSLNTANVYTDGVLRHTAAVTVSVGEVLEVRYDSVADEFTFYKGGVLEHTQANTMTPPFFFVGRFYSSGAIIDDAVFVRDIHRTLKPDTTVRANHITSLAIVESEGTNDEIGYTAELNGTEMYWDGTAWAASSGATQINDSATFVANITSLITSKPSDFRWVAYIKDLDANNSTITSLTLVYGFAVSATTITTTMVFGTVKGLDGLPLRNARVRAYLESTKEHTTSTLIATSVKDTRTNDTGGWKLDVTPSSQVGNETYTFEFFHEGGFNKQFTGVTVTDQSGGELDFNTLVSA